MIWKTKPVQKFELNKKNDFSRFIELKKYKLIFKINSYTNVKKNVKAKNEYRDLFVKKLDNKKLIITTDKQRLIKKMPNG